MPDSPVIFIQCDWDDFVRKPQGSVWVSLRKKGDPNRIHGKIENAGINSSNEPKFVTNNGFTAEVLANDMIKVEHRDSQTSSVFIAPTKIYTDIHKKSIPCLDVTTTGLGVSFCSENGLVLWDFNKGELKLKLEGHVGDVYRCKFFPSQKVVISCAADMQLKIWCAESGQCPVTLKGHKRAVTDFAIVDAGRNVISVSKDGSAKLWDCGQSSCLDTLLCAPADVNCCAISSVSPLYSVGEPEDMPSEREVGTQNKILLIGCEDGGVHCIAVYSRRKLFSIVLQSPVNSVAFLDTFNENDVENKFAIGCQNGEVHIYGIKNPKEPIKILSDLGSPVLHILPYKRLGFLVSHGEGSVYFIKHSLDEKILTLTGPDCDPVYNMATDGRFLYTSCRDGTIRRYALEKALIRLLEEGFSNSERTTLT